MAEPIDIVKKSLIRKRSPEMSMGDFGKLPPQVKDLEEAVLGAIMIEKDALEEVIQLLNDECFYVDAHQRIWRAIRMIYDRSDPIDLLTVTEQLKKNGDLDAVGGPFYIAQLTNKVGSAANVEYHSRLIQEKHIARKTISVCSEAIKEAYEDSTDVFDLVDNLGANISDISEVGGKGQSYTSMGSGVNRALKELDARMTNAAHITGVETGFSEMNQTTGGWQKTDLVIIAARPAMGKTSLLLSLANNAALIGEKITPVGIFSMEMSTEQLVMRNIAMETGVSSEKLRKGDLRNDEYQRLTSGLDRLNSAQIYIDDTPALSLFELKTKARTMVKKNGVGIIFIDYLQLMSGSGARSEGNREQEISSISRGIKGLAKELKIPIIALSQLSRAVETRQGDKKPMLSDLRESGCITGDSLIYNADDGIYYPIKDMVGKTFSTNSVNEDKKIDIDFVDSVFESGYKDVFELKLSSGGVIRATDNHQFLTFSGWKALGDILAGEYLAIPKKLLINSPKNNLTDEEIILHAHLLGDGSILPRQPYRYSNSCEDSCKIVKEAAQKQFNISCREEWSGGCRVLFFTSPIHLTHNVKHPISLFYDKIGIERDRAHLKVVSNMIFSLIDDKIAIFISHIWATDGCICKDKKGTISITYSSTSEKLIDQLRMLLLRMDIYSNKSRGKKDGYRDTFYVSISDAINQYKFCATVPLFGEKLRHYKNVEDELNRIVQTSNPNKDVIPKQCWDIIRKICSDKHIPQRQFQAGIGGHYCGTALYKRNISRKRLNKIADFLNSDELKKIAASDVLWDTVESIKYIGKETVYDATVRNNHNFIANNIVVHNSLEQDADIVIFLYRGEYYGFDTDADGNSTKGMADIIIAKHRNGPLKDVKVRFIGERTKFEDLNMTVSETGHLEPTQEKSQWKSMGERAKQYADKPVAELPPGTSQEIAPYTPPDEGGHGSYGDEDAPF